MKSIALALATLSALPALALTAQPLERQLRKDIASAYALTRWEADSFGISDARLFKVGRNETHIGAMESLLAKAYTKAEKVDEDGALDIWGALVMACEQLGVKGTDRAARARCAQLLLAKPGRRPESFQMFWNFDSDPPIVAMRRFITKTEGEARRRVTVEYSPAPSVDGYVTFFFTNDSLWVIASDAGA